MISNAWRERLIYTAMSAFVAWHSLAMVVAPAPESSVTVQRLRAVLQPYLTLFRLDNEWNFFAPTVRSMSQFRYVIEDEAGEELTFMPEAEFGGLSPSYLWFRAWYNALFDDPEDYADAAAALYCRKHAALHPVSITLLEIQEESFTPADFLAGKQRWDPEFVTVNAVRHAKCPAD
jgi:hypothetical protein